MLNNKKLMQNYKNNILHMLKVYHGVQKFGDDLQFNDFVKNYGKKKVINILNGRGFKYYKINPQFDGGVLDQITQNMFSKLTGKQCKTQKLYSKYYYSKYKPTLNSNQLELQDTQILFNCVVLDNNVNIKKCYSMVELKNLIKSGKVVLLDVKEKAITNKNYFNQDLQLVQKNFIATVDNYFLQKNIFPSIKYVDNEVVCKNIKNFAVSEKFNQEYNKVKKEIIKQLLAYEIQNQQILLSDNLEKMQNKMVKLANQYQSSASVLGSQLSNNQRLLQLLNKNSGYQNIEDFAL